MTIRICPTCSETQHLESYGSRGALFVHSKSGQMPCKLTKENWGEDAEADQAGEEDPKAMV